MHSIDEIYLLLLLRICAERDSAERVTVYFSVVIATLNFGFVATSLAIFIISVSYVISVVVQKSFKRL